jgi:hypothetical protein
MPIECKKRGICSQRMAGNEQFENEAEVRNPKPTYIDSHLSTASP